MIFGVLAVEQAYAQLSNSREKSIPVQQDTFTIDSLSIIPSTFSIQNIDSTQYKLLPMEGKAVWLSKPTTDSVKVSYRVFSIDFNEEYYHKDVKQWKPEEKAVFNPFRYTKVPVEAKGVYFGGLNKKGSISRGFHLGIIRI